MSSFEEKLSQLEARLLQDLAWLELPAKRWVIERMHNDRPVLEVAIIGGGMAGLSAAGALKMLGVQALIFDKSPEGLEGPWVTTARMETLRSPKQLTGPALGIPSLTFRAWYECQFGLGAWDRLDKIPRIQWMDYLRWYRKALNLKVLNLHEVKKVQPRADQLVELLIQSPKGLETIYARRLIMATGRDGLGGAQLPQIANTIPKKYWVHSSDPFDYSTLRDKCVGVVGAGASAMDCAATALEAGATQVDLIVRRTDLPRINKVKGAGNAGMVHGFAHLSPKWKWRIWHYLGTQQVPSPRGSTLRVSQFPNAKFNLGCVLEKIEVENEKIVVKTSKGTFFLDFLIFSTGFKIDWWNRPEYAFIAPHLLPWGNRLQTMQEPGNQEMIDSPDLGPGFEFQEKTLGECPGLSRIHCFCYPASLSHGSVSGDIPAISDGAKRLAESIASHFYNEDIEAHFEQIKSYAEPELLGNEWTSAAN
jgi:cation diffusion facilitator CzcD-associated flavoprotein CzcO